MGCRSGVEYGFESGVKSSVELVSNSGNDFQETSMTRAVTRGRGSKAEDTNTCAGIKFKKLNRRHKLLDLVINLRKSVLREVNRGAYFWPGAWHVVRLELAACLAENKKLQAISSTILRYRKLKRSYFEKQEKQKPSNVLDHSDLLLKAWKPISIGYKQMWWDCVALPEDIDCSNEVDFRMQIKELAFTSLQLLKAAIFDKECEALFFVDIYGHIIGMFELNNLDLVVASPVEDYFLYINDLLRPQKEEAEYSVCCEGTAFYPLQSCMNHSCCPNTKAFKREEDKDGQATILCNRPICEGEKVTISYIDEDLPYEERQALLADYGFKCKCPKCIKEQPR